MKKIAAILSLIMLIGIFVPTVMADEMSDILLLVKSRVNIPEECTEFQAYPETQDGKKAWSFSWRTPDETKEHKNVNLTIDENEIITSFYSYDSKIYEDYYEQKKLPTFTEEEALSKAAEQMKRLNPSIVAEYDFDAAQANLSYRDYSVNVPRVVNQIEYQNNSAYISLDHQTGEILSANVSYDADMVFPSAEGIISPEDAAAAFQNHKGLEVIYNTFYKEGEKTIKVVYAPTGKGGVIDAITGEIADIENYDYHTYLAGGMQTKEMAAMDNAAQLTEKEIEGIEKLAGIISETDAEAAVRAMPELGITDDMKMRSSRVSTYGEDEYSLYLSFENTEEDDMKRRYASASVDARTGELLNFYHYNYRMETGEKKYNETQAAAAAESFVNKYFGSYITQIKQRDAATQEYGNTYTVSWNRVENGMPYYLNDINISINMETLGISNFSLNWDKNIVFPQVGELIGEDAAYAKLFEKVVPKLYYITKDYEGKTAQLVYTISTNEIAFIDATDGTPLTSQGEEYTAPKKVSYSDLEGHYAKEAVEALIQIGAYIEGDEFMPEKIINQGEYLQLISKCVWDYYPIYGGRVDMGSIYRNAISNGVIQKDEEAPDTPLTRELAVTYLLRAMGFKRFAEIKGIFKCSFTDQNEIDEAMLGYVAIAEGLEIINGFDGAFMPKREMTRAEGITVLYNYLKK